MVAVNTFIRILMIIKTLGKDSKIKSLTIECLYKRGINILDCKISCGTWDDINTCYVTMASNNTTPASDVLLNGCISNFDTVACIR